MENKTVTTSVSLRRRNSALLSAVVSALAMVLLFQNCAPVGESGSATSSSNNASGDGTGTPGGNGGTPPPGGGTGGGGGTTPQCQYSGNLKPTITGVFQLVNGNYVPVLSGGVVNYGVGMGVDAGNQADVFIYVQASQGAGESGWQGFSQFSATGQNLNLQESVVSGTYQGQIRVRPANNVECLGGDISVQLTVTDSITAPGCSLIPTMDSDPFTFTVRSTNRCLPFTKLGPAEAFSQPLVAPASGSGFQLGQSGHATAVSGDFAVASVPGDEDKGADAGAAIVYRRTAGVWQKMTKLLPADLGVGDALSSVAISGNFIALGTAMKSTSRGAVYIYSYNGTDWLPYPAANSNKIISTSPVNYELFGTSVALTPNAVFVGAPGYKTATAIDVGAVYRFSLAANAITFSERITNPTAGAAADSQLFGWSIAASGNTLAVGAPVDKAIADNTRIERVYTYTTSSPMTSRQVFTGPSTNGQIFRYGESVAMDGNGLLIGSPWRSGNNGLAKVGEAYFLKRPDANSNFALSATLRRMDEAANDNFGAAVALSGNNIVVAAPEKGPSAEAKIGAAYWYRDSASLTGTYNSHRGIDAVSGYFRIQARVADRQADGFGTGIAVSGNTLVLGTPNDDFADPVLGNVQDAGAVHFFTLP